MQEKLWAAGVCGWIQVAGWVRPGVRAVQGCGGPPRPHSPAQRQLPESPDATCPEHILLRARPVQYRPEAECHVRAPTRRAHLREGAVETGSGPREGGAWTKLPRGQDEELALG